MSDGGVLANPTRKRPPPDISVLHNSLASMNRTPRRGKAPDICILQRQLNEGLTGPQPAAAPVAPVAAAPVAASSFPPPSFPPPPDPVAAPMTASQAPSVPAPPLPPQPGSPPPSDGVSRVGNPAPGISGLQRQLSQGLPTLNQQAAEAPRTETTPGKTSGSIARVSFAARPHEDDPGDLEVGAGTPPPRSLTPARRQQRAAPLDMGLGGEAERRGLFSTQSREDDAAGVGDIVVSQRSAPALQRGAAAPAAPSRPRSDSAARLEAFRARGSRPGPPGVVKRPSRFAMQIGFLWRFGMGAQGA